MMMSHTITLGLLTLIGLLRIEPAYASVKVKSFEKRLARLTVVSPLRHQLLLIRRAFLEPSSCLRD